MADLPKRFFFVGDEAPGAQLLAEIKQLHAEVTQSGDVWINKVFRVAAKTQHGQRA